uniref:Uncharacterized protein n=1 Tax=Peronospora matthiolae TaxID=2874970 RepID=A0AAV1USS8_9STRA
MIVEDEKENLLDDPGGDAHNTISVSRQVIPDFKKFLARQRHIRDAQVHQTLRIDLVEHIWYQEEEQ